MSASGMFKPDQLCATDVTERRWNSEHAEDY